MYPRYFHPRTERRRPDGLPLAHLLDAFTLARPAPHDVLVAIDVGGHLHLLPSDPAHLPAALDVELARCELTPRRKRMLDAEDVWLMGLSGIEPLPPTAGLNDPIQLQGTLYHPDGRMVDGALTVTRADLLAGFVRSAPYAFPVQSGEARPARCLHALLPGGREAEIHKGADLVLAWPLVPTELAPTDRANEQLCAELLHSLLLALQQDAHAGEGTHPLTGMVLPTPDREAIVERLQKEGFKVDGAYATRSRGFLGLQREVRRVPAQADLDDLLDIARRALDGLFGWPDARSTALWMRVGVGGVLAPRLSMPPSPSLSPPTPLAPQPSPPQPSPPPAPVYKPPSSPSWEDDFSKPATKPVKKASPRTDRRDWSKDFEE